MNEKSDATVIGIDVVDGQLLTPSATKMLLVMVGMACFLGDTQRKASVVQMQTILGHLAWFALLARHTFLCFHTVYDFARGDGDDMLDVPPTARAELALFAWLLPWIDGNLCREWQDCIIASDASPAFGFG